MPATTIDYGIDLGTTNSSIARCHAGEVRLLSSADQSTVTPSVVHIGKSGRILVGKRAYDAWPADPENTQAEFKRWIGFSDKLLFPASNREMSAEELSAEILKSLRADATRTGEPELTAAVITVPAAFGALQCDATSRAARLAGFLEAPLLQEPIAAAIAYGASAAGKSQRWMVFDLGGGTLDIAIVSTRNGRLAVLDHQGNNRLGGKDIDRAIAEHILLSQLASHFKLPERTRQPAQYDRFFRNLVRIAEQAKIALSNASSTPVDVFNIGDDLAGTPIEASLTLQRSAVEKHMDPLLEKCLELARRALEGARLTAADIDRVLLVGGPTQMPIVRAALSSLLGDKLDYSIDPMTVVAQGAALYSSTLERTVKPPASAAKAASSASGTPSSAVVLRLNHERASGTLKSPVAGAVPPHSGIKEIKFDSAGGVWSSGWIPTQNDRFGAEVFLDSGKPVTRFTISARSASGTSVAVQPAEFAIAYMLPMGAPPLPHTIAVELESGDDKEHFDQVFKRNSPLPAEATKTYRADRTLRPSELDTSLPIKFWEIEVSEDPQEKWWAGCVHIHSSKLKRPLTEGSEIALTIKIDNSRRMSVDVFLPSLNQGFSGDVYVPDPPTARTQLQQQLDLCFERVHRLFDLVYAAERDELRERLQHIQLKLECIAEQVTEEKLRGNRDPDAFVAAADTLRKIRVMITQLEEQLEVERHQSPYVVKLRRDHRWTSHVVFNHGTDADKEAMTRLSAQFERYIESGDQRGLKFVEEQMIALRASILVEQRWYFDNLLVHYRQPGRRFVNQAQADHWIAKGESAANANDFAGLREAVNRLSNLEPPDQIEAAREQAMRSGLK